MRILHVISSIDARTGGPAVAIRGLASAQARCGIDVAVLSTWSEGDNNSAADDLRAAGVAVELIGPTRGKLRRHQQIVPALLQHIGRADVVHIHALWEEVQHQASVVSRRLGKPYIIRPCGMLDPWSLAQGGWKKRIYMLVRMRRNLNEATALHFTAELERDLTAPLKLASPAIVEPNGLSLAEFDSAPPRGAFRVKHPHFAGRPIVLFMSRIHPKKGLDLLIPAFAQANRHNAVLMIAGPDDNGYRAEVEKLVAQHRLERDVVFLGMLKGPDRIAALQDADLFALPSYQENFGIAVVEALAAGCPVVISDQVNIHREVTAAGVGGVTPTQIEPLAAELSRWLGDAPRRAATGEKARHFAREHYDWDQIALRWKQRYAGLMKRDVEVEHQNK